MAKIHRSIALVACSLGTAMPALAQDPATPPQPLEWPKHGDQPTGTTEPARHQTRDTRADVPLAGYAYGARGAPAKSVGAQGYGLGLAAPGQSSVLGGGAMVWGAPVERLTLMADAMRNVWGNFAPSAAALFRILGDEKGWSLGALGKFKIDGFAAGPRKDEVESELELGALVSFAQAGWHLDLNAIGGRGLGDDGEMDSEGRFRLGYDVGRYVRLGLDSQARVRVGGPKYLPNGRIWDFAAGSQVMVTGGRFFGTFLAGPATMGLVSDKVGATAMLAFGGTS
jgi:hypothetical protein